MIVFPRLRSTWQKWLFRDFGGYLFLVLVLLPAAKPAAAALIESTTLYAWNSYDYYLGPVTHSAESFGTTSTSLNYSSAGPQGGTYAFSGNAAASSSQLGFFVSVNLTNYGQGSYVGFEIPNVARYLPPFALASASTTDDAAMIVDDVSATYTLEFTYLLEGTGLLNAVSSDASQPLGAAVSVITTAFGENFFVNSLLTQFVSNGPQSSIVTATLAGIPANVPFVLYQELQFGGGIIDSFHVVDSNPFATSPYDFDPSHIVSTQPGSLGTTYSAELVADFSHTLRLTSVVIRDESGSEAAGVSLTSGNGVSYPPLPSSVPEPSSLLLAAVAVVATLACRARTRPAGLRR